MRVSLPEFRRSPMIAKQNIERPHEIVYLPAYNAEIWCSLDSVELKFFKPQLSNELQMLALDLISALDCLIRSTCFPGRDHSLQLSTGECCLIRGTGNLDSSTGRRKYELQAVVRISSTNLPATEHDCWRNLFSSAIVVPSELPTDSATFGKGLETSFDLMISLAGVEFSLEINGGLVLVGYQTILVPVEICEQAVQFHLITCKEGQINPYQLNLGKRASGTDPSQFKHMRCFIGWCEEAHINLGTKRLPANVRYSQGIEKKKSLITDGYSGQLQVGLASPLNAILGIQSSRRYRHHNLQFPVVSSYYKLLQDTAKQSVVIYDSGQRRAWLVPKLALLLHMAHSYGLRCSENEDRIPYVDCYNDISQVVQTLQKLGDNIIHGESGDQNSFIFRQLMLGLNINLLSTNSKLKQSEGTSLYGFEFLDVVDTPGRGSCMKRLPLLAPGKGWVDIVNAADAVVICSNIGEAISASKGPKRQNLQCNAVPAGVDYLAATVSCLSQLIERKGGDLHLGSMLNEYKISESSFWGIRGNPFDVCVHVSKDQDSCWTKPSFIQSISKRKWSNMIVSREVRLNGTTVTFPLSGAVVFGKSNV
jgi:hypothetical protein